MRDFLESKAVEERSQLRALRLPRNVSADAAAGLEISRPPRRLQMQRLQEAIYDSNRHDLRREQDSALEMADGDSPDDQQQKGCQQSPDRRELDITQKDAWFLNMRIREAMRQDGPAAMMAGIVEADEAYIGGKARPGNDKKLTAAGRKRVGRGTDKAPVVVLVECSGRAFCKPLDRITRHAPRNTGRQYLPGRHVDDRPA